jgi:Ca2+-transporting ATPase
MIASKSTHGLPLYCLCMNTLLDDYKRLNYYRMDGKEVITELRSNRHGLTQKAAKERLELLGPNVLHRMRHTWIGIIFLRQFKNLLIVVLLISAGLSVYLHDIKTATILLLITLMNAVVGFLQEHKAESLMNSLEQLVVPKAKVYRDGRLEEIDSTELVLGDIVYIEEGDSVPADLRIVDEYELSTNDFALTGESNPTRKFVHPMSGEVPLANRHNLVFMGTTVATGHGDGIVIDTAMNTELGRIASLSQVAKADASPLQKEMNHLATRLVQGTGILAICLTGIALHAHFGTKQSLLFAIGIAAAMIPNGLVAEVNITLAQTAARLAKAKALVKKLSAVETLGAVTVIATDKTGTLTKNEMTVEQVLIGRAIYKVTGTGYEANGTITTEHDKPLGLKLLHENQLFFETGAFASNAHIDPPDAEHAGWYCVGDPTEGALITLARKANLNPDMLRNTYEEVHEFSFDSARKRMSSVRRQDGKLIVYVKGAPESVLECSTSFMEKGLSRKITAKDRAYLLGYNEKMAHDAKRNLAFAYRIMPGNTKLKDLKIADVEQHLTFLGIVSMVDPLRDQVPAAMLAARNAHIRVSIVTGDFPTTAKAVAIKAGLKADPKDITIVLGEELHRLSDSQVLTLVLRGGTVFSRVAPEDKLRIVELVKQHGQVVAVTGDGINDAPALKRADIGVAMGRTGTDVAKEASEIILLDDSFSTLIGTIEQGRITYQNIKKAARCVLTDNASELTVVILGLLGLTLFYIPPAISPIQILSIDVVAQILPLTALGWDSAQRKLMHDKPRSLHDHIINRHAVSGFLRFGAFAAVLSYSNFLLFIARHHATAAHFKMGTSLYAQATTLTYLTLVLCLYVYLMFERSDADEPFFTSYLWSNKKLLLSFAISFFLIFNIMYTPFVRPYFSTGPLSIMDWLLALIAAGVYLLVRLFLHATRAHRREAVLALHRQSQKA